MMLRFPSPRPATRQNIWRMLTVILTASGLAACDVPPAPMVALAAQPKTPAQRNLTPFYPALQCMDDLFVQARLPRARLSAGPIPDATRQISVDTRSMIITALNHMTRRSKAFAFVEQGIYARSNGDTLNLEKDDPKGPQPPGISLYISGAISQVDRDVRNRQLSVGIETPLSADIGLTDLGTNRGIRSGIVTLDLHLVSFPSRVVLPDSAVSNSMVVSQKGWGPEMTGTISQRTLGLSLNLDTIESQGQAVRSLIELGLIEMLGRHSGVPFWECLSLPSTNAQQMARLERRHEAATGAAHGETSGGERLRQAQYMLGALGYVAVRASGTPDHATRAALSRFQAQQGLLSHGRLDFDTYTALSQAYAALQPTHQSAPLWDTSVPRQRPAQVPQQAPARPTRPDDGFQSLQTFVDRAF